MVHPEGLPRPSAQTLRQRRSRCGSPVHYDSPKAGLRTPSKMELGLSKKLGQVRESEVRREHLLLARPQETSPQGIQYIGPCRRCLSQPKADISRSWQMGLNHISSSCSNFSHLAMLLPGKIGDLPEQTESAALAKIRAFRKGHENVIPSFVGQVVFLSMTVSVLTSSTQRLFPKCSMVCSNSAPSSWLSKLLFPKA